MVLSAEKIQHVPKMCFFLLKCWICWIMLDLVSEKCASFCWNVEYVEFFGVYGAKWDQIEANNSTYSTFQQKEALFGKGIQHDLTYSTFQQKETLLKKELVSGEKIQHNPKSGSFSRKNSTWPKKWFFQQKKFNMCRNVFLSYEKFLFRCFSIFFSSLSLSLSLSISLDVSLSLSVPQIPSSSALLHLCVSHSHSLSFLYLPSFLYVLLPPLSVPRPSSITLSLSYLLSLS